MLRSRTIAIAGSIAALTFAATPVAALAATSHHGAQAARVDQSRDARGARHLDRTVDRSHSERSADPSIDVRSR
jgi:Ni/Co efflux regulator RcnB